MIKKILITQANNMQKERVMIQEGIIYFSVIVIMFLIHAMYLNVVAEDAFITFRFARHLADGHGIVWNIGEAPVEGYTNFLWLILSALFMKAGLDAMSLTQLLGVLASLVTIGYTYRFARRLFEFSDYAALIPCLFLAASGPFATWAASGMETNLFGMFILIGCYYFVSWIRFDSRAHLIFCFLALFLATLTRPEGLIVFGLLATLGATLSINQSKINMRQYILALLVYIVPFLTYFFWRYNYFGFILPNTYYAKTGGGIYQYLRGAKYSAFFAFHLILPLMPILMVMLWECGWGKISSLKGQINLYIEHIRKHIGLYICSLLTIIYTLYIVYVGGDYMAMYRFFVPILPLIYLLFGLVSHRLLNNIIRSRYKQVFAGGLIAFAVAFTLLQSTPLEKRLFRKPDFMHGAYQGVQLERWAVARFTVLGNFFNNYQQNTDDSLALYPIGVISYYNTDMTIHSMYGIVDPYIAHKKSNQILGEGLPGHEKEDLPYVLSKKPTYIMFTHHLKPEPQSYPSEFGELAREHYQLRSVWLNDPVNEEAGYFTFLELKEHNR